MHVSDNNIYVMRINYEVDNIGERIAISKKRITWRFVFSNSAQVHTITLEHSLVSGKKIVKLDGYRIFREDKKFSGPWTYSVTIENYDIPIIVKIRNAKSVLDSHSFQVLYDLEIAGCSWKSIPIQKDRYGQSENAVKSKWGSDSYAQSMSFQLDNEAKCLIWIFTFGRNGDIYKLVLENYDQLSALRVCLNSQVLSQNEWKQFHILDNELKLDMNQDENQPCNFLLINDRKWNEIPVSDSYLIPGWEPLKSKSSNKIYYRNSACNMTQWNRPVRGRGRSLWSNDVGEPSRRLPNYDNRAELLNMKYKSLPNERALDPALSFNSYKAMEKLRSRSCDSQSHINDENTSNMGNQVDFLS